MAYPSRPVWQQPSEPSSAWRPGPYPNPSPIRYTTDYTGLAGLGSINDLCELDTEARRVAFKDGDLSGRYLAPVDDDVHGLADPPVEGDRGAFLQRHELRNGHFRASENDLNVDGDVHDDVVVGDAACLHRLRIRAGDRVRTRCFHRFFILQDAAKLLDGLVQVLFLGIVPEGVVGFAETSEFTEFVEIRNG